MLTLVLLYALAANIIEKPDGIAIAAAFIAGIVAISLVSRVSRTTELRADRIEFDEAARRFITDSLAHDGALHLVANQRQAGDRAEYVDKEAAQRGMNPVPGPPTRCSWRSRWSTHPSSARCSACAASTSTDTASSAWTAQRSRMRSPRSCSHSVMRPGASALPLRVG